MDECRRRSPVVFALVVVLIGALTVAGGPVGASGSAMAAPSSPHAPPPVTVSYGPDPLQSMTIYPAAVAGSPLVVMIPGDGWRSSLKMNMQVSTAKALQSAGFAVFDTNYRGDSASTPAFPLELTDVEQATAYALADAAEFGADPARVTLLGGSAGGQLAAFATEELDAGTPHEVSTVVTLSGPFDFPMAIAWWSALPGPAAAGHLGNQLTALGCRSVAKCPVGLEERWSADDNITSTNCPARWLLMNASNEEMPVEQADAMTAAARAAGCAVTETIVPSTQHGFHYYKTEKTTIDGFIAAS